MLLFAGREQLETTSDTYQRGVPRTDAQRDARVIAAPAEQAEQRSGTANDRPVHDDLRRGPARRAPAAGSAAPSDAAARWRALQAHQRTATRSTDTDPTSGGYGHPAAQERPMTRHSFLDEQDRWHVGCDPAVASYYAKVEPARTGVAGAEGQAQPVTVLGTRTGQVPTPAALDAQLAGRVQLPERVREQLATEGPARPAAAAERLAAMEGQEMERRAAAWAALSARPVASGAPAGTSRAKPDAAAGRPAAEEQDARRRETARREDDARRQDRGRGPRL